MSRLFLFQVGLNTAFGLVIGTGLWIIGVPNPALWGILSGVLRFVPYVGAAISAIFPLVLAAAVDPGWTMLLWTAGLFRAEPLVGQVIEPLVYGHSTGYHRLAALARDADPRHGRVWNTLPIWAEAGPLDYARQFDGGFSLGRDVSDIFLASQLCRELHSNIRCTRRSHWFDDVDVAFRRHCLSWSKARREIEHQTAEDTTVGTPKPLGSRGAVMADTVGRAVM